VTTLWSCASWNNIPSLVPSWDMLCTIQFITESTQFMPVCFSQVTCDNLVLNDILGLIQSFSCNHCCTICYATQTSVWPNTATRPPVKDMMGFMKKKTLPSLTLPTVSKGSRQVGDDTVVSSKRYVQGVVATYDKGRREVFKTLREYFRTGSGPNQTAVYRITVNENAREIKEIVRNTKTIDNPSSQQIILVKGST